MVQIEIIFARKGGDTEKAAKKSGIRAQVN
jgi:hypothetical protein